MSSWPPAHIVSKTFFAIVGDMAGAGRRPVPLAQKFRKPFLALEHARARGFAVAAGASAYALSAMRSASC